MAAVHQHVASEGVGVPAESARKIWPSMHPKIRFMAVYGGK